MQALNLCFTIDCLGEDSDHAAPIIHHHLNQHLTRHNLEYTSDPTSIPLNSSSTSALALPWTYLMTHKGQRSSAQAAKLNTCNLDVSKVTHAMLYSNARKLCQPVDSYSGYQLVYISMFTYKWSCHGCHV